ncbi:hypothetical protein BN1708_015101 [Verticillium longisporum]|uniref:Uncharacterized protein n=1 Tax=Verticillium longisporum TaxID=100787 RepID=A0A0G4M1C0_VERLO|nr:hypothetical protein BN1708_015101 [Verticillium longisporum]
MWNGRSGALNAEKLRLQTSCEDAYDWQVLPEKQYLFEKNLSNHSIRVYKEFYDSVGLEAEVKQRLNLDDKLKLSYERTEELQNNLKSVARGESYFRDIAIKYSRGISRLVPILDEL